MNDAWVKAFGQSGSVQISNRFLHNRPSRTPSLSFFLVGSVDRKKADQPWHTQALKHERGADHAEGQKYNHAALLEWHTVGEGVRDRERCGEGQHASHPSPGENNQFL